MHSQLALPLDEAQSGHGGAREGAGRKRRDERTGAIRHRERATHTARFPVHVTLRAVSGAPPFRQEGFLLALHRHIAAACERGRRIVHFSLQDDHLHNIIEATDRENMARTIQGFASIVARAFNRVAYQAEYRAHFGPGGEFVGYIDSPTRLTLRTLLFL